VATAALDQVVASRQATSVQAQLSRVQTRSWAARRPTFSRFAANCRPGRRASRSRDARAFEGTIAPSCLALGGPFDERHIISNTVRFACLQTRAGEFIFARAAEPTSREDRQATPQTHLVCAAKVETVVTNFQEMAVGLRAAQNRDSARTTADCRASLLERSASGVP